MVKSPTPTPTSTSTSKTAQATAPKATNPKGDLSFGLLVALVVGSIIGSGIFAIPQNMTVGAGTGAILIGWLITAIGMLSLARVYQSLAIKKPELDNGVFSYARALSGEYASFNSAWGYWISAWIGNVGYLVAAFGALGYFFPVFGEGNTVAACIGSSIVLWIVHFFVLRGIQGAAVLNAVVTMAKLVPLVLFIILVAMAFEVKTFLLDFWGDAKLGSVLDQIRSTMLVTVWVFIGIEGASVYSSRAKNRADVGRATIVGFLICLVLLAAISLLSLGVYSQAELAALKNPSMAGVLEKVVGHWGALLIYVGLIVSVGGGLLAWTLLAAETLFSPSESGVMPKWLSQKNANDVPANSLWVTNGLVQVFLIVTVLSKASYLALISLSTVMILVPYLFSAGYAFWLSLNGQAARQWFRVEVLIAALATVYCTWLIYAAGSKYLLLSALLYAPGMLVFVSAKKQLAQPIFNRTESVVAILLWVLAAFALYMLIAGRIAL
jgi:arginine:ornithine antiporter / lysine permease